MDADATRALVHAFEGEAAVTLVAGPTALTVLPELGLLGAGLVHDGGDILDLHGGPAAVRAGHTSGLPLLAPWANRLGGDTYRIAGREVDLGGLELHRDGNGLPMHGSLIGRGGWAVSSVRAEGARARLRARFDAGAEPEVMESFPFPHLLDVLYEVNPGRVTVTTTLTATGSTAVPVSFGWHPYLRLGDTPREKLRLSLPARHRLVLDERQIPTGQEIAEPAEEIDLAGRTFDDGYRLGGRRRLELDDGSRRITLSLGRGYPFTQVYAPDGHDYVALEPMTAPADALRSDRAPLVAPGASFTARFALIMA